MQYKGIDQAEAKQYSIKALTRLQPNNALQALSMLRENSSVQAQSG
jgi:hypothetical protein